MCWNSPKLLARQEHLTTWLNMVREMTLYELVCLMSLIPVLCYIHHFTWPTWASKSKSLFRSATVPRFLAPTRVGLLRHVADKTVPAAASASPSPFVSFDYGGVINLYQPTRLQDITRYYIQYYFWCTSGCPDGSRQASHSLLSGNGRRRQVEVTLNDLMQLTRQARAAPCSNRALGWQNGPSPSISSVD